LPVERGRAKRTIVKTILCRQSGWLDEWTIAETLLTARVLNSMNNRWVTLVSASLVAFAIFVISWQVGHYDKTDNSFSSIYQ
jgi:hypothetical protein